jgi:hypothetical protein
MFPNRIGWAIAWLCHFGAPVVDEGRWSVHEATRIACDGLHPSSGAIRVTKS